VAPALLDPGGPERVSLAARDVTEPPGWVAIDVSEELAALPCSEGTERTVGGVGLRLRYRYRVNRVTVSYVFGFGLQVSIGLVFFFDSVEFFELWYFSESGVMFNYFNFFCYGKHILRKR